jgi:hypothetical protein
MPESTDQGPHHRDIPDDIVEDLFNYAIDREETKYLLARMPQDAGVKPLHVEYELQTIKIISVGWCLSYYLQEDAAKDHLVNRYWESIRQFAESLSETTGLMIGQQIDYFQILKARLDRYVAVMSRHPRATDPIPFIGPEFAELCGDRDDLHAQMCGAKMFNTVLIRVKKYLLAAIPSQ